MKVNIKLLSDKAKLPSKAFDRDFCMDCYATSCEEIAPNVYKYGLGIAIEIDYRSVGDLKFDNLVASVDVRPRSSIWKTGLMLSNGIGTIDEPYRGELGAVFYHVMPSMPKYEVGDRICQIKLGITENIEWNIVDSLSETERGSGGYGHTGNK